jgi:tetratricopeptide (TPR) repeat protein
MNTTNMKKKSIALFSILFLCFSSLGQLEKTSKINQLKSQQLIKDGEDLLDAGRAKDAYMVFKSAIEKDPNEWEAYFWVAMTELELTNFYAADENAQKAELLISDKKSADLALLQGQIKHRLGALNEAMNYYSKAKEEFGEKNAAYYGIPMYLAQCKFALDQKEKGILNKCIPFSANVNSTFDEYGAILSSDGLHLFFTARTPESKGNNENVGDQRFFEDIVHYEWEAEKNEWILSARAIEGINTEGFDALNYISKDGKYALGTINTAASKEKSTKSSDIFEVFSDETFLFEKIDLIKNKAINTSYFDGAATITDTIFNDNGDFSQTLYFVSDRKAEESMTDIYSIERKNGVWMDMKNPLKTINTDGRETTPFITPNGRFLFFSSDALPGMGGYDVYYSENVNGVWGNPVNLGATFNSVNDDTHFQVYPRLKKAVIARINENEGLFNYDIFQIDLNGLDFPFLKD